MEHHQKQLDELDNKLNDSSLYEDSSKKTKLDELLQKRSDAHQNLHQIEEEWLELSMGLES